MATETVNMANRHRFKTIQADNGLWEVRLPFGATSMMDTHLIATFGARGEAHQYARFRNISRSYNGGIDTEQFVKLLEDKFNGN